jgi:hypothetical protein
VIETLKKDLSNYVLTLVSQIESILSGKTMVDEDTLNKMNLLMLLQTKTNKDPLVKEKLITQLDEITDKVVANMDFQSNNTLLFGDSMYSGQIYMSNELDTSKDKAIANKLPIYNVTECENILREVYNLSENDSIIYVTSATDGELYNQNSTSYKIIAYDSVSKKRLNLDYCEDINNRVEVPLDTSQFNMTLYNELKDQGIDIFDQNDSVFNDRCISYTDNSTGSDTTLNWRRQFLFAQKVPMCVGFNCTYQGVSEFNYLKCDCTGLNTGSGFIDDISKMLLDSLTEINIGIVTCYKQIPTVNI